ncbi:MAG: pilus assembly protein PilZ [Gammaproteobacteria bacterium]|nr:MAG: pilus assembly protein PilZ [Gammaproteobacteria bacterium]
MNPKLDSIRKQRGAVLIVSLIMLLVLTLLGFSAIQNTTLEERMAGSLRSGQVAFEAAESALRGGEAWIDQFNTRPLPKTSGTAQEVVWVKDSPGNYNETNYWWQEADADWWSTYGQTYGNTLSIGGATDISQGPRFLVEELGLKKDTLVLGQSQDEIGQYYYQVTARGTGVNTNTVVKLRSTYARRY